MDKISPETAAINWTGRTRSKCKPFQRMAGSTGLEPAASAVTGQRSNQLNYDPTSEINVIPQTQVE